MLLGRRASQVVLVPDSSRTFDFQAGDVGYIPVENSHYVENTGNTTVVYLIFLQAPRYIIMSLGQWLGLTPPQIVKDTLHLPQSLIDRLPKVKNYIVPGDKNLSTTDFTPSGTPAKRNVNVPQGWTRNARLRS